MELRDGATAVREWIVTDETALAVLADDRRIWLNLRDAFPHPYGLEDARRFIAMALQRVPPSFFAITHEDRLAGAIGYATHADVERIGAEIGYWVAPALWGRGLATTALRLVVAHAFRADPGLRRVYAVPYATNPASARVLEKAGFTREGTMRQSAVKDGKILDQWLYSILRDELPG